jgi:hypothetical protein
MGSLFFNELPAVALQYWLFEENCSPQVSRQAEMKI